MKKSIFTIGFLAATFIYADETTYVNYGQTTISPQFNLIWEYQTETSGSVTYAVITGVKDSGSDYPSGDIAVPVSVSASQIGPGLIVKKIADGAFANQIGITSISLPNTVENVGAGMFTGCSVLSKISVDESNPWLAALDGALYDKELRTIYACPALKGAILLPETLTDIDTEAFAGCHQLVSLDIPASVTSIGPRAFLSCKRLSSITFKGNAPEAPADIASGDIVTPINIYKDENSTGWDVSPWNDASIFTIENGQSQSSGILTETAGYVVWHYHVIDGTAEIYFNGSAAIPKSTTQTYHLEDAILVGDGTLNVPSTLGGYPVTGLGDGAFKDCASLKSITLSESIRSIGAQPIAGTAVVSLDFPDSLRELKGNPLAGCDTILNVSIAADNSYYSIIDNVIYDKDVRTLIGCPARKESISIPQSITTIGSEAFRGCFRLRELQLPQVLTDIGEKAFQGAIRLTTLDIPTFVANIGSKAFADCVTLAEVTYTGNAPTAPGDIYDNTPATMTSYAKDNATGFTAGTWKNRPISIIKVPDAMNQVHDDGTVNWTYNVIDGKATITGAEGNVDGKIVTIPGSLDGFAITALDPAALDALSGVKAYESSSTLFVTKNGCLYSSDGKTLIRVPNGLTLPYIATRDESTERVTVTTIPGLLESGNPGNDGTSVKTNKVVISSSTKTAAIGGDISFNAILEGVTGIVDHAFYGCNTSLTDEHSDSSTTIGGETGFIGANGDPYVKTVTLESSVTTTYTTVVALPASVTSVADKAFEGSAVEIEGDVPASSVSVTSSDKSDASSSLDENENYIGWIVNVDGLVTGTVTAKTGKRRNGILKVTGSAVRIGSKKTAIKSESELFALGDVRLVKDISKSQAGKSAFKAFKGKCWTMAYETAVATAGVAGYVALSVSVSQNGKVRVKGNAPDGTKITGTAQMVKDGDQFKIPIAVQTHAGKKGGIALCLDIGADGSIHADSSAESKVVVSGNVVTLQLALVDAHVLGGAPGSYLLVGDEAAQSGFELDSTLKGWNPRYTKSSGEIKGNVNFYGVSDGRRVRATVSGIAVGGVGYCSVTVKKVGSWPALIVPLAK